MLVIGLDAATFEVMTPLLRGGELPTLQALMHEGASGPLRSTIPPLSPAAWVSAMTGKNPARHGVFDFRHVDPNQLHGRKQSLASSGDYAGTTIFDLLGDCGMHVGAFHIPLTYPPWPVNGVMVSGPVTPDQRRAYTHPPALADGLEPLAKHRSPEHLRTFDDSACLEELIWDTKRHVDLGLELLQSQGLFDLFWFHLHSLDTVQHRFWKYVGSKGSEPALKDRIRYADAIDHLYRLADRGVAQLVEKTGPDSLVVVLSDHGARPRPPVAVRFNRWLQNQGLQALWGNEKSESHLQAIYRRLKSLVPAGWRGKAVRHLSPAAQKRVAQFSAGGIRWSRTAAYYFPMTDPVGGIVINLKGRQLEGCVDPAAYEPLRHRIMHELHQMQDPRTGDRIIQQVWRREEIYSGPFVDRTPDVVFMLEPSYHPLSDVASPWIARPSGPEAGAWSGVHAMDGILIARGPGIASGTQLRGAALLDIMPTLLYAMGQPIPSDVDGRALVEAFSPEFREERNLSPADPRTMIGATQDVSDEDTEAMMARLRALGYVE